MTSFDVWMSKLDSLMFEEFHKYHVDFDDYNWFDEFDNDVDPEDAFDEWKAHTENGSRSPGI